MQLDVGNEPYLSQQKYLTQLLKWHVQTETMGNHRSSVPWTETIIFAELEVFNQFCISTTDRQKVTHKSPPCNLHSYEVISKNNENSRKETTSHAKQLTTDRQWHKRWVIEPATATKIPQISLLDLKTAWTNWSKLIRIGPDRAYPLHFTRPQLLLLLLLPVLLPLLFPSAPLSGFQME